MFFLELTAITVIFICVVSRPLERPMKRQFLINFVLISAAGWSAEESCILLYGFYAYSPGWSIVLDRLPMLVVVVWPLVVISAWELASQIFRPGHRLIPLAAGAIVLTDALLVETVSVHSGLWSWNEPGIFNVPPIGVFGWACFAFLCVFLLEQGRRRNLTTRFHLLILLLPVFGTHLLLLVTWWGVFRWINIPVAAEIAVGSAWVLSLLLVFTIVKHRIGTRVEKKILLMRLPAALFFFTLLALYARDSALLIAFGIAFAPPYLTMMAQQYLITSPEQRTMTA
jgi:hypothetical protein